MGELIGFRALQGIGAGGLMVGAQAIIADIVPPRERGRYMGLIGSVFAVASVAGPLLGGFFVEALSWRWVFYVNLPIGAVAVLVVIFRLHLHTPHAAARDRLSRRRAADRRRQRLILLRPGVATSTRGTRRRSSGSASSASCCCVAFVFQERRARGADHPAEPVPARPCSASPRPGLPDRPGDVRRDHLHPAVPAARLRRLSPTGSGLRMLPLMAGLLGASILSGPRDQPRSAATSRSRSPAPRSPRVGMFLLSRLERRHARRGSPRSTCSSSASGSASSCRCWCSSVQNDAPAARTSGSRPRPRRSSARWAARWASRCSGRSSPRAWATSWRRCPRGDRRTLSGGGVNIRPARSRRCRPRCATTSSRRSCTRSQPVFLVGAALTAVAFALSWFLKEVPLRGATGQRPNSRRRRRSPAEPAPRRWWSAELEAPRR